MDRLSEMFIAQADNDRTWVDKARFKIDSEYRNEVSIQRLLEIHEEVTEIKNSLGLSKHKLQQVIDPYNTKMQIIDVLKYLIGLADLLEFDAEDIHEAFIEKTNRLRAQWAVQKTQMTNRMKVVCIDIDGCVANYEDEYVKFYERGKGLKPIAGARADYSFYKRYKISIQREEELYDEFVKGGGFRRLGVYPHAKSVIKWIVRSGLIPVFVTARPAWLYGRIYEDTQAWKEANGLGDIMTIFDKDKADVIINKIAPAKVVAFIEDRDKHAIEIAHLGVQLYLINRSYNQHFSEADFKTIKRVDGWEEIGEALKQI